jgi:hypothetical protein
VSTGDSVTVSTVANVPVSVADSWISASVHGVASGGYRGEGVKPSKVTT